jgi:hypothetical protein
MSGLSEGCLGQGLPYTMDWASIGLLLGIVGTGEDYEERHWGQEVSGQNLIWNRQCII